MKNINFVKGGVKKRATHRHWPVHVGNTVVLFLFVTLSVFQVQQWRTLFSLKREIVMRKKQVAPLDEILERKQQLSEACATLQQKIAKLTKLKPSPTSKFALFGNLHKIVGTTGTIRSLSLAKKTVSATISYPDMRAATRFMKRATELPAIKTLHLVSITPNANRLQFVMKGKLV